MFAPALRTLARGRAAPIRTMTASALRATSAPRTFSAQDSLPRLPVPKIEDTLNKYLRSIEPILRQKAEFGELPAGATFESELAQRRKWAEEFVSSGVAARLNQRLADVDATTENNWLDDRFWLVKAYHEWRVPLLVNSNWWLMFQPDPTIPEEITTYAGDAPAYTQEAVSQQNWANKEYGLRRATWMVYRLLLYRAMIVNQTLPIDVSRAGPFCMHQYDNFFGVTRIPARPHDWNTPASRSRHSRHITVIVRDNYYELEVLNESGEIHAPAAIEAKLAEIVEDGAKADGPAISVLSSDERDIWALEREHLLTIAPENKACLDSAEKSLFVLSLDSSVLGLPSNSTPSRAGVAPAWSEAISVNASGAGRWAHNRFFDKAISIIVEPNGRAAMMGEHSPVDALIPSIAGDFAVSVPMPPVGTEIPQQLEGVSPLEASPKWKKLPIVTDARTDAAIEAAENRAKQIAADTDFRILWFDEYGADWIKKVAKQAPDAYLQMALQLAHARVTGRQIATYETASTRAFKHGRTDVIRSFSNEAYDFVKAFREKRPAAEIYERLTAATKAHSAQTRDSAFGKGIDRHLLGLRLAYNAEDDGAVPQIFADPLFTESQSWVLSTSGLSAGNNFAGTGFGCGFPDGFGVNYLAGGRLLKFGMESKRKNRYSNGQSTELFLSTLAESLRDMRKAVEEAQVGEAKPKL
ncbi:carnitine O-acetyltransferase [Malassezia cuniculi]|uniref:Carnitine O-acetyltransferase n=1 Tax=Malassezia cuniculi TaxID=948313 RepID=A0AAF0ER68_9BASI|nr:carnitine O-acetyltransferase [Malassezia cuniculi]